MEEFDDLVQQPDDDGVLDYSHRAWVTLDDSVWTWSSRLLILNVSYNNMLEIPPEIGNLILLRYWLYYNLFFVLPFFLTLENWTAPTIKFEIYLLKLGIVDNFDA